MRADSVVSGEELVGGLMEPGVSAREMAKMRKSKRTATFPKEEKAGVSFYNDATGEIEKEDVNVETGGRGRIKYPSTSLWD